MTPMTGAAWSSRSPARRSPGSLTWTSFHSAAASAIGRLEPGERGDFVRVLSRYLACVEGMEDEGNVLAME